MSYADTIKRVKQEIADKKTELDGLLAKQANLASAEPRAVAEYLHEKECHWNHTDGCSWFYETWDGELPAGNNEHTRWLQKAERLIAYSNDHNVPVEVALEIRGLA